MESPLLRQVALVTGAAQGIGEAIAFRLAAEGADLALVDIAGIRLQETAAAVKAATGRTVLAFTADVTDHAAMQAATAETVSSLGRLDLAVANAGIVGTAPTAEFDEERWRRIVDVNLSGYMITALCAIPYLRKRGGTIVHIDSISGTRGATRNTAYCASKSAGLGLTESLALELADDGIGVFSICPGHLLDSPLWVGTLYREYAARYGISEAAVRERYLQAIPMHLPCTVDDIANAVVFLAQPDSRCLSGEALHVNGGAAMR